MITIEQCEAAYAAADAALVPDEDRAGPGSEPVDVSGWYAAPTVSGRTCWVRYDWRAGRCVQGRATYDLGAEQARTRAVLSDPRA
ncbi:MAG: hypothetical protein AAB873_00920 [Patescibacteria group bacterium]